MNYFVLACKFPVGFIFAIPHRSQNTQKGTPPRGGFVFGTFSLWEFSLGAVKQREDSYLKHMKLVQVKLLYFELSPP